MDRDTDDKIAAYFGLGFSNKEIMTYLAVHHGIILSSRTLKRRTCRLGLFRRKNHSDVVDVALYMINVITNQAGDTHGYRWMHAKCINEGFVVSQKSVRLLLGILDPEGVGLRRRRRLRRRSYANPGPNAVWHIDGCDKLAPYGLYIHGCVDGFSRYTLWMSVSNTNKDPSLIGGYYIKAIEDLGRCPGRIRSDRGTENTLVCEIQRGLRNDNLQLNAGGLSSFMYGKSTTNQRIEWRWGLNRKEGIQYWMNAFQRIKDDGYFSGDFFDKELIRFCFANMVQVLHVKQNMELCFLSYASTRMRTLCVHSLNFS
jgi:hypothetical protein